MLSSSIKLIEPESVSFVTKDKLNMQLVIWGTNRAYGKFNRGLLYTDFARYKNNMQNKFKAATKSTKKNFSTILN